MASPTAKDDPVVKPAPNRAAIKLAPAMPAETKALVLDCQATLTLGDEALLVHNDRTTADIDTARCCSLGTTGLWDAEAEGQLLIPQPSAAPPHLTIPFYNILWAELLGTDVVIHYANAVSKDLRVATLSYPADTSEPTAVAAWLERLLDHAYGKALRKKRAKVLVNPHSGPGKADRVWKDECKPLFQAAQVSLDVVRTKRQGEAMDISEQLDINAYDVIVACSGDGLPYEIFNGLGKRADATKALHKLPVVLIPCGSGNALSCNLSGSYNPSHAALAIIKGLPTPLDLISITQGDTRTLSFLSQAVGILAEADLATEHLRFLGGARFTYGFLVRLLAQKLYPCDLAVKCVSDDKAAIKEMYRKGVANVPADDGREPLPLTDDDVSASSREGDGLPPLRYGTVHDKLPEGWELVPYDNLGTFYCGNMCYVAADTAFFTATLPNDGCMDVVCIDGDVGRMTMLNMMGDVDKHKLLDNALVSYRKVVAYRLIPKHQKDGYISIDGERIPFAPFQAEVHRGLGTVLTKNGRIFEAPGPL